MTTGQPSENTWKTATDIWGGMMIMSNLPGYPRTGVSEWWTPQPAAISFFSDTGLVWFRGGSSGAAMYLSSTYADGFNIGYPGGGYEGNYGAVCYYLAIQTDDNLGMTYGYQGAPPVTLGWEPNVFFTLASGGLAPGPGDIAFADFSVPSFAFGGMENSQTLVNLAHNSCRTDLLYILQLNRFDSFMMVGVLRLYSTVILLLR